MLWSHAVATALAATSPALFAFGVAGHFELQSNTDYHQQILQDSRAPAESEFKCHLPPALDPVADGLPAAGDIFSGEEALMRQVTRLGALVKIPSVSYDDAGKPGEDPRWDVFYQMHDALATLYPVV